MTKKDAKKYVVDAGLSKYSKSVVQVLRYLIQATRLKDVKISPIEKSSCPSKLSTMQRELNYMPMVTLRRALVTLKEDGLISVNKIVSRKGVRHTHTVHLTKDFLELPHYLIFKADKLKARKEDEKQRLALLSKTSRQDLAMLRDFQETIRTDGDYRTPEETFRDQLPARHVLAEK